ncbi:hypothetical protein LTR28_013555, partial [Elasticomyces elasticus]
MAVRTNTPDRIAIDEDEAVPQKAPLLPQTNHHLAPATPPPLPRSVDTTARQTGTYTTNSARPTRLEKTRGSSFQRSGTSP